MGSINKESGMIKNKDIINHYLKGPHKKDEELV